MFHVFKMEEKLKDTSMRVSAKVTAMRQRRCHHLLVHASKSTVRLISLYLLCARRKKLTNLCAEL